MELNAFLQRLNEAPSSVAFNDTIAVIDAMYEFTPTTFRNGGQLNEAGKNSLQDLLVRQTAAADAATDAALFRQLLPRGRVRQSGRYGPSKYPEFHQDRLVRHRVR
jgi:hypothetical protein